MKKTILIDYRWSKKTGIGRHVDNALPVLIKSFKKIYLLTNQDIDDLYLKNLKNVELIKINSKVYSLLEQFEIYFKRPRDYDVCWFPNYNAPIFLKNKIIHIHDLAHVENFKRNFLKSLYSYFLILINIIFSKKILTVSEFSKKKILGFYPYLFIKNKVKVIYPGVFDNPVTSLSNEREKIILSVGTIKKRKNFITLVKAFSKLTNDTFFRDYKLMIVGQKSQLGDLDYEVLKYESEKIIFCGSLSDNELKNIFAKSELFVFPSLYEGFGIPPIEAMQNGIPVICSDIPVLKEVCKNAVAYFSPLEENELYKKMKFILKDEKIKKAMIENGLSFYKRYSWKNYNKDLLNELKS